MAIENKHKGAMLFAIGHIMHENNVTAQEAATKAYEQRRIALFNSLMSTGGNYQMFIDEMMLMFGATPEELISSEDMVLPDASKQS